MSKSDWKHAAELIGIAALVASLIFVGLQMRQEQNIAVAQIFADHDDTQIEWARLVTENNEVWVRGLKGEELGDEDSSIFYSLTAAYFHKENDRYQRAILISGIPPTAITADFAHMIHSYPGLESAWRGGLKEHELYQDSAYLVSFDSAVLSNLDAIENGKIEHIRNVGFAPN